MSALVDIGTSKEEREALAKAIYSCPREKRRVEEKVVEDEQFRPWFPLGIPTAPPLASFVSHSSGLYSTSSA